jgi:hypothetical protein
MEYTQTTTDTWEKAELTFPVDTTGTWRTDSSIGMTIYFSIAMGANYSGTANTWGTGNIYGTTTTVNNLDSTSNNMLFAGVKLEAGSEATDFQHTSYGEELAKCHRYYQHQNAYGAYLHVDYEQKQSAFTFTPMRASPTATRTGSFNSGTENASTITIFNETSGRVKNTNMGVGGKYNLDAEI